ncbi:LOW QUALITY PROTEIN: calmodulin-binding transcription activator 2-like [Ptychodera flava]|uniref:LOW QUALITY PROTEIN: calmodulin-binding transcription activator 2-like n=1 Tax=Ptychodera flava TaxID=63121 RepID=UPI00396A418B
MLLVNRKQMKSYRRDGFCWKKRKDGKTTREDHMKLKVNGVECIYGCYVHSAVVPTFHRRSYWLLQNPDIVLLHYLNAPSPDEPKTSALSIYTSIEQEQWTKKDLIDQIKPMFSGVQLPINGKDSILDNSAVESLVDQILSQSSSKHKSSTSHTCVCHVPGSTQPSVNGLTDHKGQPLQQGLLSPVNITTCTTAVSGCVNTITTSIQPVNFTNIAVPFNQRVTTLPATTMTGHLQSTANKTIQVLVAPAKQTLNGESHTIAQPNPVLTLTCVPTTNTISLNSAGQSVPQITRIITNTIAQPTQNVLMSLPGTVKPGIITHSSPGGKGTVVLGARNGLPNTGLQANSVTSLPVTSSPVTVTQPNPNTMVVTSLPNVTATQSTPIQTMVKQEGNSPSSCSACGSIITLTSSANSNAAVVPQEHKQHDREPLVLPGSGMNNSALSGQIAVDCGIVQQQPTSQPSAIMNTTEALTFSEAISNSVDSVSTADSFQQNITLPVSSSNPMDTNNPTDSKSGEENCSHTSSLPFINQSPFDLSLSDSSPGQSQNSSNFMSMMNSQSENRDMGNFEMTNYEIDQTLMANLRESAQNNLEENSLDALDLLGTPATTDMDFSSFDAFEMLDSQLADFLPHLQHSSHSSTGIDNREGDSHLDQENTIIPINQPQDDQQQQGFPAVASSSSPDNPGFVEGGQSSHDVSVASTSTGPASRRTDELVEVTDFCPEWSYPEGGIKVLVTGPWDSTTAVYSCLFHGFSVPAALVQNGVLRCYCPAHENGFVPLQVAVDGVVVSKTVMFEYKARSMPQRHSTQQEWLSLDENQFKMAILERLEQIEKRMVNNGSQEKNTQENQSNSGSGNNLSFEDRLVEICESLVKRRWSDTQELYNSCSVRGMTLLHIAAALGYDKLITLLVQWRADSPSVVLEIEVDPLNVDHFSCTPLMWACALGHCETALLLYHWQSQALSIPDYNCRLPDQVAKSRGHVSLAEQLERLKNERLESISMETISQRQLATPTVSVEDRSVSSSPSITIATSSSSSLTPTFDLSPQSLSPRSVSPKHAWSPKSQPSTSPLSTSPIPNKNRSLSCSNLTGKPTIAGSAPAATSLFTQGLSVSMENTFDPQSPAGGKSQPTINLSDTFLPVPMQIDEHQALQESGITDAPTRSRFPSSWVAAQWSRQRSQSMPESSQKEQYLMLAEKIIDALPARIKVEDNDQEIYSQCQGSGTSNADGDNEMYRTICYDLINSPSSTLSPNSSSCLQSPSSMVLDDSDSEDEDGTQMSEHLSEFLRGGKGVEKDLSLLTLSDYEQRHCTKLPRPYRMHLDSTGRSIISWYNVAFNLQGRQRQKQQELEAAVIIQSYYRRYKQQYVSYKKMTQAAVLIQSRFRSYHKHKQYKQSRQAALLIQNRYRSYREHERFRKSRSGVLTHQQPIRLTESKSREQIAARKIQRFLKQNRHRNIWDMKERLKNMERSCRDSPWLHPLASCVSPDGMDGNFN